MNRIALGLCCMFALMTFACSTAPKPTEMVEFEALRKSDYTQRITKNETALPYLKASDEFYALALEFYDDEEMPMVKHYSLLGAMKYRSGEAIARREDAQARVAEANDKYLRQQKFRNEHNSKQELLAKSVSIMEREKKLLEDKIAGIQQDKVDEAQDKLNAAKERVKTEARDSIAQAEISFQAAEKFKAREYATGAFNQAMNKLNSARKFLKLENFEQAAVFAVGAKQDFEIARDEAKPFWEKDQGKLADLEMNKKLLNEAQQMFPGSVREEGRGTIVILGGLFKRNKAKISKNETYQIDTIMALARKYPDYKILIEGHTVARGNSNRNLSLSQTRATTVRDYFIERNFPVERMLTVGKGGDYPHFNDRREKKKNDRVDVVFLYKR